jgi:hypothetical protein
MTCPQPHGQRCFPRFSWSHRSEIGANDSKGEAGSKCESSAYVHEVAPPGGPTSRALWGARRGDFERALGVGLAADIVEVEVVVGGSAREWRRRLDPGRLTIQHGNGLAEGRRRQHPEATHGAGLRSVIGGVAKLFQRQVRPTASTSSTAWIRPSRASSPTTARPTFRGRRGSGEDAEGDGQVDGGAFLAEVGGGEVDGDPIGRKDNACVPDRGANALATLPYRLVRQTDGRERRKAAGDVDLDAHERCFHTDERGGQHTREHDTSVA